MENFLDYALKCKYEQVKKLRPRLEEMKQLPDWKAFLQLFPDYHAMRGVIMDTLKKKRADLVTDLGCGTPHQ